VVADLCSSEDPGRRWRPWWVLTLVEEFTHDDSTATYKSMAGTGGERGWAMDRHLLAAVFDAVQVNTVVAARVAGAKRVKSPQPFPRPGAKPKSEARTMSQVLVGRRRAIEHQERAEVAQDRLKRRREEG
jgi:hypothetical protein